MKKVEGRMEWFEGNVSLRFSRVNPKSIGIKYEGYNPLEIHNRKDLENLKKLIDEFLKEYPAEGKE